MEKLNSVQKTLLGQLSMSLFHCDFQKMKTDDWQSFFEENIAQAVSVLTYQRNTSEIPTETKQKWERYNHRILGNNIRIDYEHSELHGLMSVANIP